MEFDNQIHDRLKLDPVRKARYFAINAHSRQRYDDKPYYHHILYVEKVLLAFGFYEDEILMAGMLHDSVEDQDVTLEEIHQKFGLEVRNIVWGVTDISDDELLKLGLTPNRENRKHQTYPRTKLNKKSIIVKLADRIANVEYGIIHGNERKGKMYKKEHDEFRKQLYNKSHGFRIQNMWAHLEGIINLIQY